MVLSSWNTPSQILAWFIFSPHLWLYSNATFSGDPLYNGGSYPCLSLSPYWLYSSSCPEYDLSWMNLSLYCLSPPLKCKLTERRDSCLFGSLPYPPLRNKIWCRLNAQSVKGMNDWPLCCLWNPYEGDRCQQPLPLWPLPRFPHSLPFILRPQSLPYSHPHITSCLRVQRWHRAWFSAAHIVCPSILPPLLQTNFTTTFQIHTETAYSSSGGKENPERQHSIMLNRCWRSTSGVQILVTEQLCGLWLLTVRRGRFWAWSCLSLAMGPQPHCVTSLGLHSISLKRLNWEGDI